MRIGLINTALDESSPPMNLAHLGTSLKSAGLSGVKIIDHTFGRGILHRELKRLDCVGISAMTKHYKRACEIARRIRRSARIPVIVGGVHISTAPESLSPDFALGVIGEGERTITALCKSFDEEGGFLPQRLKDIPGLIYWDNGELVKTPPAQLVERLDDIPMPDLGLLDERYFKKRWISWSDTMGRMGHVTTARGCPYNCVFCAAKQLWKVPRFHSAERMLNEVNELVGKWGVDHIVLEDDLFSTHKDRLRRFADLMDDNGLSGKVRFSCSARTNLLDEDMCEILKRVGVKSLDFGFESGSEKVLGYLKRNTVTVEDNKRAIHLCSKYGFQIHGASVMLGSPVETLEDMKKTLEFIDYAMERTCHKVSACVVTPLPGTVLWDIAKQRGHVSDDMNWDLLDFSNCDHPMLLHPDVDAHEFKKVFSEAAAKLDSAWMRGKWLKTLALDHRRVIRKVRENPRRILLMLRNLFFKRG